MKNKIYNYLIQLENELSNSSSTSNEVNIQSNINDIKSRLKIKLKTGKCSNLLINQLAIHQKNIGEVFGKKKEFYDSSKILDLIGKIESNEVIGKTFSGSILSGYMHIHHNSVGTMGSSLVRNIREYWFTRTGQLKNDRKNEFEKLTDNYGENNVDILLNNLLISTINNKKLNGEWIIYKIQNDIKYYLCLATHTEGLNRKHTDEVIYNEKISKCFTEFPALK